MRPKPKNITQTNINKNHPLNNPLIETIRLENGILHNLQFHQARMDRSRQDLFQLSEPLSLAKSIVIPAGVAKGLYKCRVIYDTILRSIAFESYRVRPVRSLQLVISDPLNYEHKWLNRSGLLRLYEQRGQADDVLIVKNGRLTDTTYANIALYDGHKWYTPAEPLLAGTRRAALLEAGELEMAAIKLEELRLFKKIRLINALLPAQDEDGVVTLSVQHSIFDSKRNAVLNEL
ncbi:MAG TPA: aminotransferase class IV [Saprospiraceae bacterium]|nr:aminotransferase class IV [Saprospiraceae bacterium]HMQ83762.1 aminotransferase class IV [Saprospiraceae bacterium]